MPNHELTPEERARGAKAGGLARAAKYRRLRQQAEDELLDKIRDSVVALAEALTADATVYSKDGETYVAVDHPTRIRAAAQILDRALGKPVQRTELTGADSGPIVVEHDVSPDDARSVIRGLADRGLVRSGDSQNGHTPADEVHPT